MHTEGCAAAAGVVLVFTAACMVVGFWPVLIFVAGFLLIGFAQNR